VKYELRQETTHSIFSQKL